MDQFNEKHDYYDHQLCLGWRCRGAKKRIANGYGKEFECACFAGLQDSDYYDWERKEQENVRRGNNAVEQN